MVICEIIGLLTTRNEKQSIFFNDVEKLRTLLHERRHLHVDFPIVNFEVKETSSALEGMRLEGVLRLEGLI